MTGYDSLTYSGLPPGLRRARRLGRVPHGQSGVELSTALAGIESFHGRRPTASLCEGSDRADRITALARYVLVRERSRRRPRVAPSGPGLTQVSAAAATTGSRASADRGVILNGGRGADVLRGDRGPDQLRGDLGRDVAWGQQGKDECKTEVRHGCE